MGKCVSCKRTDMKNSAEDVIQKEEMYPLICQKPNTPIIIINNEQMIPQQSSEVLPYEVPQVSIIKSKN